MEKKAKNQVETQKSLSKILYEKYRFFMKKKKSFSLTTKITK